MTRTERARVNPDGTVVAVYTDTIDLRVVGHVRAVRASAVEWDEGRQAWVARILATGVALGPFPTRAAAVDAERTVLGAHLFTGTPPVRRRRDRRARGNRPEAGSFARSSSPGHPSHERHRSSADGAAVGEAGSPGLVGSIAR